MSIRQSLVEYRNSVQECNDSITAAFNVDVVGDYILERNVRELVSEASFLKMFISWERFLEQSFLKYLTGKKSILNNKIVSCVKRINMEQGAELIKGTNKYIDWSNPDIILRLAKLYFGSNNPYSAHLNPIKTDLFDIRTIRNAAAHLSTTTSKSLDSLASRMLGGNQSNVIVADFILKLLPGTTDPIIDHYIRILDITAEKIANA